MIHDTRSPHQKAQDANRCPTCGHRPQDEYDRLVEQETGTGAGFSTKTCPACKGAGGDMIATCARCSGSGRVIVTTPS